MQTERDTKATSLKKAQDMNKQLSTSNDTMMNQLAITKTELNQSRVQIQALKAEKTKLESEKTELEIKSTQSPEKSARSGNTASPRPDLSDANLMQEELKKRDQKYERLNKSYFDLNADNKKLEAFTISIQNKSKDMET